MVQSYGPRSQHQPPKLLEQVREAIRVRHYSLRTEATYLSWIKRFILLHGKRHPRDMGVQEVHQFLSWRHTCRIRGRSTLPLLVDAVFCLFKGEKPDLSWLMQHEPLP